MTINRSLPIFSWGEIFFEGLKIYFVMCSVKMIVINCIDSWLHCISFMYVKIKWYHGHLPSSINSSTLEKWVWYLKSKQSVMLTMKKWYCSTLMTISLRIFWFIIGLINFFFLQSHEENPHFYKIKITFCFNNHNLNLIQTSII